MAAGHSLCTACGTWLGTGPSCTAPPTRSPTHEQIKLLKRVLELNYGFGGAQKIYQRLARLSNHSPFILFLHILELFYWAKLFVCDHESKRDRVDKIASFIRKSIVWFYWMKPVYKKSKNGIGTQK